MTTITLFKLHSGFANVADDWSLDGTHANEYRGDYSEDYILPAGYSLGLNMLDDIAIYDAEDRHWTVSANQDGNPVLVSSRGFVDLEKAA